MTELKFLRVEDYAGMTGGLQKVNGSPPMVCEIPKDSVVDATLFTREVREDGVKP